MLDTIKILQEENEALSKAATEKKNRELRFPQANSKLFKL